MFFEEPFHVWTQDSKAEVDVGQQGAILPLGPTDGRVLVALRAVDRAEGGVEDNASGALFAAATTAGERGRRGLGGCSLRVRILVVKVVQDAAIYNEFVRYTVEVVGTPESSLHVREVRLGVLNSFC